MIEKVTFHVETQDDFFFVKAKTKQDILNYFHAKRIKINAITQVSDQTYSDLLEATFIKAAIEI